MKPITTVGGLFSWPSSFCGNPVENLPERDTHRGETPDTCLVSLFLLTERPMGMSHSADIKQPRVGMKRALSVAHDNSISHIVLDFQFSEQNFHLSCMAVSFSTKSCTV